MKIKIIRQVSQLVVVFFILTIITACSIPTKSPIQNHTLTAEKAYNLLNKNKKSILFVDVRAPAEVASQKMPTLADANVPFYLKKQLSEPEKFGWEINKDFVPTIESRLKEKGLDKHNTVILICRRGNRSAKAANVLAKAGYENVYSIEGGSIGEWKEIEEWAEFE